MSLKVISPEGYEQLDDQTKKEIDMMTKELWNVRNKPYQFKRSLYSALTKMFNIGVADAVGGEVVEEGRCIKIDKGEKYEIACPYCGEVFDINLEGMLPQNAEGYGVKL